MVTRQQDKPPLANTVVHSTVVAVHGGVRGRDLGVQRARRGAGLPPQLGFRETWRLSGS